MSTLRRSITTRKLAVIGMLSAISIVLGLTPMGFIPLGPTKLTIMHLPVILGAIVEGPIVGLIVGAVFGLFSIYQAVFLPSSPVSILFANPLISLLPRLLIGPAAYGVFHLFTSVGKRPEALGAAVSAVIGTLVNTVGVLTMLYFVYGAQYAQLLGLQPQLAAGAIWGLVLTNGLPESVLAAVIITPAQKALRHIIAKRKK